MKPASTVMTALAAVMVSVGAPSAWAANPSMSQDFSQIMGWLATEMAQGLAFNAGSTFDPPGEVRGARLWPDLSLGVGVMPLDKSKFPIPETQALQDKNVKDNYPSRNLFPNLTMHLRAGLPGRMDFGLRFTDMTTPKNYKMGENLRGEAQSNSFGFIVRRHFYGGGLPLLSVGASYNHVFGHVNTRTNFRVDDVEGFSADSAVNSKINWNINSFGLNAVVSQSFGGWTPFAGLGYNYATGSVRARLDVSPNTPLIAPIIGEASRKPESSLGRVILGFQLDRSWMHLFANGEIKAGGAHAGESWIMHIGMQMPFRIGGKGLLSRASTSAPKPEKRSFFGEDFEAEELRDAPASRKARAKAPEPVEFKDAPSEEISDLIFLQ